MTTADYTLTLHDGTTAQPLKAGQPNVFKAQAGARYRILKRKAGEEQLLDDVIARRLGDDLRLDYADGTQVTVQGYFDTCKGASACDITLPGQDVDGYRLDGEGVIVTLGDGSVLIYTHGSREALIAMAQGGGTLEAALSVIGGGGGFGDISLLSGLGIVGGAAVVAGGGSGSGESAGTVSGTTAPVPASPAVAAAVAGAAVSSASGARNRALNAGDTIEVTVTFSDLVTVTGDPQLALNIGGTIVHASYVSGSGSKDLVFAYTIAAGQSDDDGIEIAAPGLSLNGGAIRDAAGNAVDPTQARVAGNLGYVVDTTPESILGIAVTGAGGIPGEALKAGDAVSVTVTMSAATLVSGTPQLALKIGESTVPAAYVSGSGTTALVFSHVIQAGEVDSDGICVDPDSLTLNGGTLTDQAGNAAILSHAAVADNAEFTLN